MPRPKRYYTQPSKEDLELVVRSRSLSAAARQFCGTLAAIPQIRAWCKEYNILIPPKRVRRKAWMINKPTRDQLEHILQTTDTMREIAAVFDVSTSTIYKWIKYFKLRR